MCSVWTYWICGAFVKEKWDDLVHQTVGTVSKILRECWAGNRDLGANRVIAAMLSPRSL